jgi:hypothetical protein
MERRGDAYPYTHDLMSLMQRIEGFGYQVSSL